LKFVLDTSVTAAWILPDEAAYLEPSMSEGIPLATWDTRLRAAAVIAGVVVVGDS
jgi:hypothetical protein